ncbi:hypothetical protein Landi51_06698 [Colletotrichum acutatum]
MGLRGGIYLTIKLRKEVILDTSCVEGALRLGLFPTVELQKSGGSAPTFHRPSAVASGAITPRLGARGAGHGGTRHGASYRNSRINTTSASPAATECLGTTPRRYRRDSNGTTTAAAQFINPAPRLLHRETAAAAVDPGTWHGPQSRGARLRLPGWTEENGRGRELCAKAVMREV